MATSTSNEIIAVGRRKSATARVRMKPGTGVITVNGKTVNEYMARDILGRTGPEQDLHACQMDAAVGQILDGFARKDDARRACTSGRALLPSMVPAAPARRRPRGPWRRAELPP